MSRERLKERINTVEAAYEFMLSYAARGMRSEGNSPLRSHLEGTASALEGMGDAVREALRESDGGGGADADGGGADADGGGAVADGGGAYTDGADTDGGGADTGTSGAHTDGGDGDTDGGEAAGAAPIGGLAAADIEPFIDVLEQDAAASLAAIHMVLARAEISSQLVDNLNASIHLRALLTDLFLIDEALDLKVGATSPPARFAPDEGERFGPED